MTAHPNELIAVPCVCPACTGLAEATRYDAAVACERCADDACGGWHECPSCDGYTDVAGPCAHCVAEREQWDDAMACVARDVVKLSLLIPWREAVELAYAVQQEARDEDEPALMVQRVRARLTEERRRAA